MNLECYPGHCRQYCRRRAVSPRFAPGAALLQLLFAAIFLVGLLLPVMPVNADEIRPALLDIKEQNTGLFAVTWKVPTRGDRVLLITPRLPESLELLGSPIGCVAHGRETICLI